MESNSTQKLPLVLKKHKISVLKKDCFTNDVALLRCMKVTRPFIIKEDVIYRSEPGDFMKGEYPNLIICNRLNILSNSSRTIAKYVDEALGCVERTSDDVAKLIGQKNYDTVFSALCSVISQELRIQGILALLTIQKIIKNNSCQTILKNSDNKVSSCKINLIDASSQTDETCSDLLHRLRSRKKAKRPLTTPYVVRDVKSSGHIKRLVIKPQDFEITKKLIKFDCSQQENKQLMNNNEGSNHFSDNNLKISGNSEHSDSDNSQLENSVFKNIVVKNEIEAAKEATFPELKLIVDEDSNISDISSGNISITSCGIPLLLENPIVLLNDIEKYTQEPSSQFMLTMLDGSQVKICGKPEDQFHIATAEILKYLNPIERSKVMWHQAYIDWKFCLQRDEDNNLPIHLAVLNNDVDLVRRQCAVLKSRKESVDIPAHSNLTALQMSIIQDFVACTSVLLQHGANPLLADEEQRTAIRLAAEASPDHLRVVIDHCKENARRILQENEMWKPELEEKSDEEIAKYLLSKLCRLYDEQGNTPLTVASKLGNYTNVKILLDADPNSVNLPMPNCGSTALYIAVVAACIDVENSSNKSKSSEHFLKTVDVLVKHGADPSLENNSGNSVNLLLNEFRLSDMSMIIANAIVAYKYPDSEKEVLKDFSSVMLVKEDTGVVNLKELKNERQSEKPKEPKKNPSKVIIKPTVITKCVPVSSGGVLTKILGSNKSPPGIITYTGKGIQKQVVFPKKTDPSEVKSTHTTQVKTVKAVTIDKQNIKGNCTPTNMIKTPSKILAGATSTMTMSPSNLTTVKCTIKKKAPQTRDQTRDIPIKKQKRDLDQ